MDELLKNISIKDLEKLRMLLSILPIKESTNMITLRIFEVEYLDLIKQNRSKAYYISVKSAFKHLTNFFGKQIVVQAIGLKGVEGFVSYLQLKANKGCRVYFRTLNAAFNKAVEWGYTSENFFKKVKLPKRQKLAPGFINSDQLTVISGHLKNDMVRDVVVFAFYTGMRLNEILNLRWKNVDLQNNVITVGDDEFVTKGRKQRFIPMSGEARRAIENVELRHFGFAQCKIENERQKENKKIHLINGPSYSSSTSSERWLRVTSGYVFCKRDGNKYCGNYISRKFKSACIAAGIDNSIHFHSLRHSFASDLVQKGVPLYTIKELLGHSSISTTEIYSHMNMESLREAIEKLGPRSEGQGSKREEKEKSIERKNELKIFRINSGEK